MAVWTAVLELDSGMGSIAQIGTIYGYVYGAIPRCILFYPLEYTRQAKAAEFRRFGRRIIHHAESAWRSHTDTDAAAREVNSTNRKKTVL